MLIITPNGSIITTPDPLIVRRFKLLYIFAQQIESDHLLDQLEILAEQGAFLIAKAGVFDP